MRTIVADTETSPILKDDTTEHMWIFGGKDVETGEVHRFYPYQGQDQIDAAIAWAETVDHWVGHNWLAFDTKECARHIKKQLIDPKKVTDTLIVSRLLHYDRRIPEGGDGPHSLKSWGIRLGLHKGDFHDFSAHTQEMEEYWEQDLEVGEALYLHLKKWIDDPDWEEAIRIEHEVQLELMRQKFWGFQFNTEKAKGILSRVNARKEELEAELAECFPPKLKLVNTINYTITKDGEENHHVKNAREKYALTQVMVDVDIDSEDFEETDTGILDCYDYVPFKPGSPKDRIEALWEAGWKPFEKTKTHQQFSRKKVGDPYGKSIKSMTQEFYDKKKADLEYYGWVVNEDNLRTLPDNAPEGAGKLAQWLTLEGRRSSLVEWIGQVQADGRIHGNTNHIGAWTGRGSHSNPNTANISSVWPEKRPARSPVEEIKKMYDTDMRACWEVPEGSWLVGVDADGIQLRILGDYLWRHYDKPEYAKTIAEGKKEDETDIHNVNRKALGLSHLTRDDSKTFIYAWVLNAGDPKIASILRASVGQAVVAKNNFEASIPGLKPFKDLFLPSVAKKGWFTGYDGRKVIVPSLHKTLAGILQNGEAVLMKHAKLEWNKRLRADHINYKALTWVHDEWQTEVIGTKEEAEHVKNVQADCIAWAGKELGFLIDTPGSGSVGLNWSQTH